jgi:hypothetical protein
MGNINQINQMIEQYDSRAKPYLEKPILTEGERSYLESIFYEGMKEAEEIFPSLSLGEHLSDEERRCFDLLTKIGKRAGF